MSEIGIDISTHRSKNINEFINNEIDYVVTVCAHAHETCPLFPGKAKIIHKGFDDPPFLAAEKNSEEEKLECYRKVRDEIRNFVETLPEALN